MLTHHQLAFCSREVLINFTERVLPLQPDVITVLVGRNDLVAQAYNNYRDDYAHFRDPEADFRRSNYALKMASRISRLALMLINAKPGFFSWNRVAEHPVYATVRWDNCPNPSEIVSNLQDPMRTRAFSLNVQAIVDMALESGIKVFLITSAYIPEKMTADFLPFDSIMVPALRAQMNRNNDVIRKLAKNAQGGGLVR